MGHLSVAESKATVVGVPGACHATWKEARTSPHKVLPLLRFVQSRKLGWTEEICACPGSGRRAPSKDNLSSTERQFSNVLALQA